MAKARKPLFLAVRGTCAAHISETYELGVSVQARSYDAAEARRLAAWLVRAAEWIEGREGK